MERFLPGATLGILGGGQLGRMLAIEARRFGYRVAVFTDAPDSPAGEVSNVEIVGSWDDAGAIEELSSVADVVTYEFENIPTTTLEAVASVTPSFPSGQLLHTTQNRLREKTFLRDHGIGVTDFRAAASPERLQKAIDELGAAIVKTAAFGYDGKGQARVDGPVDAGDLWEKLGAQELIVEKLVPFDSEVSVIVASDGGGSIAAWDVTRNEHVDGILDVSVVPSGLDAALETRAGEIAFAVAKAFGLRGLLCVEMFVADGEILVNEIAPRPHNSGHWTIDGAVTNQFEQQLRSVCGLPLGDPRRQRPTAMANLLGDLWADGEPDWSRALEIPGLKLHLYGKQEARPGRKMGHLTIQADTASEAKRRVLQARSRLSSSAGEKT